MEPTPQKCRNMFCGCMCSYCTDVDDWAYPSPSKPHTLHFDQFAGGRMTDKENFILNESGDFTHEPSDLEAMFGEDGKVTYCIGIINGPEEDEDDKEQPPRALAQFLCPASSADALAESIVPGPGGQGGRCRG